MHGAHFSAGSSMIQSRDTYNMCVWQLIVGWQEMHMARKKPCHLFPIVLFRKKNARRKSWHN